MKAKGVNIQGLLRVKGVLYEDLVQSGFLIEIRLDLMSVVSCYRERAVGMLPSQYRYVVQSDRSIRLFRQVCPPIHSRSVNLMQGFDLE